MIKGIAHLAFQVSDMEASVRFYEEALRFKLKFVLEDPQGNPWIVYLSVNDDQFIELFYAHKPLENQPKEASYQHLCIEVDDIHELAETMKRKGIPIDNPVILGMDNNYQFWIHDPDGNQIELMEYGTDALQKGQGQKK